MVDRYTQRGQIYYAPLFNRSVAAATGLGIPLINLQAPVNGSIRLREVVIGNALGSTTQLQCNTIRFARNATVYATEGGVEITPENAQPWSLTQAGTQGSSTLRAVGGITAAAAATEGGKLLYVDTIKNNGGSGGANWRWDSWANAAKCPWADNGKNLVILLHATDTTVVNCTATVEVMSRNT